LRSARSAAITVSRSSAILQFGQSSKYSKVMSMRTTVNLDPRYKVKS